MLPAIEIIFCILLGVIAIQDYKYRAVSWIVFPVLFIFFLGYRVMLSTLEIILSGTFFNLFFIIVNLLALSAYFSIKEKRLVNLSNGYIGWGDILFFICLTVLLSPFNFMLFYLATLLLVVLASLIYYLVTKDKVMKVPLAGIQAFILIVILLAGKCWNSLSLMDDSWIINQW